MENVSELTEPRVVVEDWNRICAMTTKLQRQLWVHLMATLDGYQKCELSTERIMGLGVDRTYLWKTLREMEAIGLIQKVGHHWDIVRVNPEVVHVNWLRGEVLKRRIAEFRRGSDAGSMAERPRTRICRDRSDLCQE